MKANQMLKTATLATAVAAIALIAAAAQAAPSPAAGDLGDVMKDMAKQVLEITLNSGDPSKNAASAAFCDSLLGDIATARGLMPPKIQGLPQSQQSGQMAQFQGMIDQLSSAVSQMKTDFVNGNNNAVTQDLGEIEGIKQNGHAAFKGQ